MNSLTQFKNTTILPVLIALVLACFALSPQARAVCEEGCDLTNENTFLGDNALVNNTTGDLNTATGAFALYNNNGGDNTATGHDALYFNLTGSGNTATGLNALLNNTPGSKNIAVGFNAGFNLTTGNNNPVLKASLVNNQHCWMPAGRYDKGIPEQGSIAEPAGANRVLFPDW